MLKCGEFKFYNEILAQNTNELYRYSDIFLNYKKIIVLHDFYDYMLFFFAKNDKQKAIEVKVKITSSMIHPKTDPQYPYEE